MVQETSFSNQNYNTVKPTILTRIHCWLYVITLEFSISARLELIKALKRRFSVAKSYLDMDGRIPAAYNPTFCAQLKWVLPKSFNYSVMYKKYEQKIFDVLLLSHFKPSIGRSYWYPLNEHNLRMEVLKFMESYYTKLLGVQISGDITTYNSPVRYMPLPTDVDKWLCLHSASYMRYYNSLQEESK